VQHGAGDRETVIRVWLAEHPFPDYLAVPRRAAKEFESIHPEYRIELSGYDFQQLPAKVAEAAGQGAAPEIAEYYYTATQLARDTRRPDGRPLFTSVERAVGGRGEVLGEPVVLDDIVPAARDYYTYGNDLTSLPATITTTLLFVNKTLLRAAGVAGVPGTWGEVEAACDVLAASPHGPPHGITWPNHGWLFQQALAEQGGLLADNDNGRTARATAVDLASEPLMNYVRWWKRLHEKGHYLYSGRPWDWSATLDAFMTGQVAFMLTSSVVADSLLEEGLREGFELGVSQLPRSGLARYAGHMVSGQSLWLADGLDQARQDGALAFMQYLMNPRNAAEWHKANGFLPATASSFGLLADEGWFDAKPHQRVAGDQLQQSDRSAAALGALLGDFAGIQYAMTRAMDDVLVHDADPDARFSQATREAQQLLDAYNADCAGPAARGPASLAVA
jgi:sn-glycerol 3-phosphate transport system substrate-binding protein